MKEKILAMLTELRRVLIFPGQTRKLLFWEERSSDNSKSYAKFSRKSNHEYEMQSVFLPMAPRSEILRQVRLSLTIKKRSVTQSIKETSKHS